MRTNLTNILQHGQYVKCLIHGRGQVAALNGSIFGGEIAIYFERHGLVYYDCFGQRGGNGSCLLYPSDQALTTPGWNGAYTPVVYSDRDVFYLGLAGVVSFVCFVLAFGFEFDIY